jgi:hypothetical protein
MGSPMQSTDHLQRLLSTAAVTVHPQQSAPSDDQAIWLRIPTAPPRCREGGSDLAPGPTPAVVGSSALATSHPETLRAVFRPRGHLREVGFAGRVVCLRDMQGFRLYAEVLGRPHTRVPAVELRAGLAGVDAALFAGSSGPMVTGAGLADLRRSYEELSEELAEAELNHDEGAEGRLREELEQLAQHVARAVGKDGRPRQVSDAERARITVAKAMSRARATLKIHHPMLLAYLLRTVQTGSVWCYQPDEPLVWELSRDAS